MSKLVWDNIGERLYETGVEQCAVYPASGGAYPIGHAWNGLTAVNESPSGAESTSLFANNGKYLNLVSVEEFGASIEAYTYPDAFAECNGELELVAGMNAGQQTRKTFGLVYKTLLGNDTEGTSFGYKLHVIYGAVAAPSEKNYATVNDSPEAMTLSWELTTTPVAINTLIDGVKPKPTALLTFESTKADPTKLAALEAILYGSADTDARLPFPDEIITLMSATQG